MSPASAAPPLMSTADVAAFYSVSNSAARRWANLGMLPGARRTGARGVRLYDAHDIRAQWDALNPTTPHPGCTLLSRTAVAAARRIPLWPVKRLCTTGQLPTVTVPSGHPRIPKDALPRFREHLEQLTRNDRIEAFAAQIEVRPSTAHRLLLGFGLQGRPQ
ncbi:MAG TPA: hypothetical protein VKZ89_18260 [Thermobifida alba]|nr:hypothetical protein [Thermobifida alba]